MPTHRPDRRRTGGSKRHTPSLGNLLILMALACLAPLAALALVDGDIDGDNVTAAGGGAESTRDPNVGDTSGSTTTAASGTTEPSPASGPAPTTATTGPTPTTATTRPASPGPTTATTSTTAPTAADSPIAQVVALANVERAAATPRCGPLRLDGRLTAAAQGHSDDMSAQGYFAHTSPEGTTPLHRAAAAGYGGPVTENIAQGYRSAEDVMAGWMASDSHRANILDCDYTVIGVGFAAEGGYWTQMFGLT
jgi:uncharacterized protein YkwD